MHVEPPDRQGITNTGMDLKEFLRAARNAPYIPKREFVREHVSGKSVLDLGCVAHTLQRCLDQPDTWLHNVICRSAHSVLGVDILEKEVAELNKRGYHMMTGNALTLRLETKFEVIVCGDLIEHVDNLHQLLETIKYHLLPDGIALVTTPNPFAASRFFNILADGWTGINTEHICWFCPQTMFQLAARSGLTIDKFFWLETDFSMPTEHFVWGKLFNRIAPLMARWNQFFRNDFGVVLKKR